MRMRTGGLRKVGNNISEKQADFSADLQEATKIHLNKGKTRGLALARTKVGKDKTCFET